MNPFNVLPSFNRRDFLARCSASAAGAACFAAVSRAARAPAFDAAAFLLPVKAKVRLVYTHPNPSRQGWPYQNYNYEGRKQMLGAKLKAGCPDIDFQPVTAKTAEEAKKILAADEGMDGYLVYMLGIPSGASSVFAYCGRPTLLVDDLYGGTGHLLNFYPKAREKGMPVAAVASSRLEDVAEAANTFAAIKKLRSSTLLDVTERNLEKSIAAYREALGLTIQPVSAAELNAAYEKADRAEAEKWAKTWIDNAQRVVEPSRAEIRKSAAMFLGMRDLLLQRKAQGIAVDCLHLFYGNKMTAYPCLGFFQFNSSGLVGACEADLQSASTMLLMRYLTGRPGYISDPVIDTSQNRIIYAHCVAPNRVYGPGGPRNPYQIRSHSEDRKGAAIRSLMPLGKTVTSMKLVPSQKLIVLHQATTVDNIEEDRACRTKLAARVKDARKLLAGWNYGWHRVTFFGDWKVPVETAAQLLGFKLVEEG